MFIVPIRKAQVTVLSRLFLSLCFIVIAACDGRGHSGNEGSLRQAPSTLNFPVVPNTGGVEVVRAFPALSFQSPVAITHAGDGSNRLFVVEQGGMIKTFANSINTTKSTVFLDISSQVTFDGEEGLLGLAFDPEYSLNGIFYVYYSAPSPRRSVVARYRVSENDPNKADPTSAEVVIEVDQPFANHNGGTIAFGLDGYLYIGLGDGGSGGDPLGHGQDTSTLLGAMLRINPRNSITYTIPPDNPFVGVAGVREEIWAYGLRNPYRFSFDRKTGELWLADVGQNAWEEINIIVKGANYGWNLYEGNHEFVGGSAEDLAAPIYEYNHSVGQSITGGNIYRGSLPDLQGKYIYADFVATGQVWALSVDSNNNNAVIFNHVINTPNINISGFGEDEAGELYIVSYGGELYRFQASVGGEGAIPETLSATGIFNNTVETPLAMLEANPGILAYDVNLPFWSDYTIKRRWLALPGTTAAIDFSATEPWSFPIGSVMVKHFEIQMTQGDIASARKLETRVLVREQSGWNGYTYKWRADESDADLLLVSETIDLTINLADGTTREQRYLLPSSSVCTSCHTSGAGSVLGIRTHQLNRSTIDDADVNQLAWLNSLGYFSADILSGNVTTPSEYPAYPRLDDHLATVADRSRAYMAANCAHCHQPAVPSSAAIDLRYGTALDNAGILNSSPLLGDLGVEGANIIMAGDKQKSTLWLRMGETGEARMPPIATSEVDHLATDIIGQWINSL